MFRLAVCALMAALLLSAAAPARAAKVSEEDLAKALKENPDLLLDVLRQNQREFYAILESAASKRRRQDAREAMLENLKDLKTPVVEEDRVLKGDPKASVTIVEFSDYQCPYCKVASQALAEAMKEMGKDVRLIFKNYPLNMHKSATLAAYYYEAVFLQSRGLARKFHKELFAKQEELDKIGDAGIRQMAIDLGADPDRLEKDLRNPIIRERLTKDAEEFRALGYKGVPVILINGLQVGGGPLTKENILDAYTLATKGEDALEPIWVPDTEKPQKKSGGLVDEDEEDCMECLEQ